MASSATLQTPSSLHIHPALPSSLADFSSETLAWFYFAIDNQLIQLPASISELSELCLLDLRGNPMKSLPETLLSMPKLEKLDLRWISTLEASPWLNELEQKGCSVYK